jgi:hypothetical protein
MPYKIILHIIYNLYGVYIYVFINNVLYFWHMQNLKKCYNRKLQCIKQKYFDVKRILDVIMQIIYHDRIYTKRCFV